MNMKRRVLLSTNPTLYFYMTPLEQESTDMHLLTGKRVRFYHEKHLIPTAAGERI